MKFMKLFNEDYEYGIFSRLWNYKESDFKHFLYDIADLCDVDISYCYFTITNNDKIKFLTRGSWDDPNSVDNPPTNKEIPGIYIRILFSEINDIEKSALFFSELSTARGRFAEKYGDNFYSFSYKKISIDSYRFFKDNDYYGYGGAFVIYDRD